MNEIAAHDPDPQHPDPDRPDPDRRYLPGMGLGWLLPLYDPLTRLLGMHAVHRRLADQAGLDSAARVLEIGCGTGNLALLVTQRRPQLEVVGLNPDAKALARAAREARRLGLDLQLDRGFADELPHPDATFDRVLSALMFHHLDATQRVTTLREVLRVLRPGGSLHLVDFGGDSHHLHGLGRLARRSHKLDDNWGDRIPTLMREAGLSDPAPVAQMSKHVGPLTSTGRPARTEHQRRCGGVRRSGKRRGDRAWKPLRTVLDRNRQEPARFGLGCPAVEAVH